MELHEIMPFVRYCNLQRYLNNQMYRGNTYLIAYDSRMFYCLGGSGEIEVDGTKFLMNKGVLLIFKSNMKYRYLHSEKRDMECISANFDFTYENAHSHSYRIPPDIPAYFKPDMIIKDRILTDVLYIKNAKELEGIVLQLKSAMSSNDIYKDEECSALMKLIITKAVQLYDEEQHSSTKQSSYALIDKIYKYIDDNAATIKSSKQVSDVFSYHPYYLNRLSVKYKGSTLHNYITKAKIAKAIDMLVNTEMSVSEIAEKCGFFDSAHFSKQFKAVTGYSPTKYRFQ